MNKGDLFEQTFRVTEEICNGFIVLFDDKNPLHTDNQFAKSKGFREEVIHGNILGGFLSYFIGEGLPLKNVIIQTQEIKFRRPVYKNDYLLFKAEVKDIFPSVHSIELSFSFENQFTSEIVAKGKIQIGII